MKKDLKMYVLVDKSLSTSQQTVQACHAVAEYLIKHGPGEWTNGIMVALGLDGEKDIINAVSKLHRRGTAVEVFREPDIGNAVTAAAAIGYGKGLEREKLL